MPMWRCPHCGTPQPVTARCWVCRRSSTSCGTCRHFRGSVAANIGYCGLARDRRPLRGDEIRACWEEGATVVRPGGADAADAADIVAGQPVLPAPDPIVELWADLDR